MESKSFCTRAASSDVTDSGTRTLREPIVKVPGEDFMRVVVKSRDAHIRAGSKQASPPRPVKRKETKVGQRIIAVQKAHLSGQTETVDVCQNKMTGKNDDCTCCMSSHSTEWREGTRFAQDNHLLLVRDIPLHVSLRMSAFTLSFEARRTL